jgi:IclR family transcriptional regulator, acetate operon repressor
MVADGTLTKALSGRGVLDGAFMLLDVLSHADNGLGLTALSRETGLAKTTVHRLVEQLVKVGAAQRIENRYFVGPTTARLGRCWQPDPQLRHAAYGPIRTLAELANTAAAVYVQYKERAHLVTAAVCRGQSWLPPSDLDAESLPRTAVARVLLATAGPGGAGGEVRTGQWQRLRSDLRDWRPFVTDDQNVTEGIRWVAAPIWRSTQRCAAAVGAFVVGRTLSPDLKDLVVCAAQEISRQLHLDSTRAAHTEMFGYAGHARRTPTQRR